jgi:hypothetical protein
MNKNITAYFYEDVGNGLFRCKLCTTARKQTPGTGYSNLIGHLSSKHDDYQAIYNSASATKSLSDFGFVSETTNGRYQWMRWVVARNLPITEVDNDLTRSMSIWKPISSKTLKKLMEGVAAKVGAALATEMGELFGLIFDGWSHASLH